MVLKLWHVSESPVGLIKRRLLSPTLRVSGQPIWGSLGFSGVLVSDGSQVTWMLVTLGPHLETRWPGGLGLPSGRTAWGRSWLSGRPLRPLRFWLHWSDTGPGISSKKPSGGSERTAPYFLTTALVFWKWMFPSAGLKALSSALWKYWLQ